jgi:hypothetical protein
MKNHLVVCNRCGGTGNFGRSICSKCFGSGKLDWVSNVVGKRLRSAIEIYPDCVDKNGNYHEVGGYGAMIEEFGKVLVRVDDDDYQGDTRVLYENNGQYGYLKFGWGSCSGCDALYGCCSVQELDELIKEICQKIMWFDSRQAAIDFFENHDWKGDYDRGEEQKEFVEKSIKLLKSI